MLRLYRCPCFPISIALVLSVVLSFGAGCGGGRRTPVDGTTCQPAPADSLLFVRGTAFVDAAGRQVLLHGVSVGTKSKQKHYLSDEGPEDFRRLRDWGFNCIRFMVFWDGIEPGPGVVNTWYLKEVATRIRWASKAGLFVLVDMHQDLYSSLFADGAPAWATLTKHPFNYRDFAVWSDAYFTSPAVQEAWDNFWANNPGPDGVGLQDHYARAWQALARVLSDVPGVVGYDLMNEPFPGSSGRAIMAAMLAGALQILAESPGLHVSSPDELLALWGTTDGRNAILHALCDTTAYKQLLEAMRPFYAAFEHDTLSVFYRKVARAIREVDRRRILFLETALGA
ncbi:MAG: glycoside hydrolase family 5 protein, partial [Calditrichaeota bacterium]|nr:glycoside hydrolase family 5 protein [Calditrichota bacterium]